MTDEDNVK